MNDHTALAANETSKELMLNGGNKPQVKRSSKLPVQISKAGAGGVRQSAKTSHGGECIRNQQSANHGLSKNQIPENCVHLERSKDKENSELPVMLKSENVQHRYTALIVLHFCVEVCQESTEPERGHRWFFLISFLRDTISFPRNSISFPRNAMSRERDSYFL